MVMMAQPSGDAVQDSSAADATMASDSASLDGADKVENVFVPAGTFSDCWRAQGANPQNFIVYCRGIGPVLEQGVGGTEAKLVSKNF